MAGRKISGVKSTWGRKRPSSGIVPRRAIAARPVAVTLVVLAMMLLPTPAQAHSPPSQVTDLGVIAGESFVVLYWRPSWVNSGYNSSWSEEYRIYRGVDGGNMTLYVTKSDAGFNDLNVTAGAVYRYNIVAFNEHGEGPGVTVDAYPRPAPNVTSYSPAQVEDCDLFTATLEWSPPSNTTSVIGYHIYTSPGRPLNVSADARNVSLQLGGWGPHIIRLSAVYDDGIESFDDPVYIGGPLCEGAYSPLDELVLVLPLVIVAGGMLATVLVILHWRKMRR